MTNVLTLLTAFALLSPQSSVLTADFQSSAVCPGDCDGDGLASEVEVDLALSLLFDAEGLSACARAESDDDGIVRAADLVAIVAALGALPPPCGAMPVSSWTTLAPLGEGARQEVAAAAIGDDLYVLGGFDSTGRGSAVVERYDPASDAWTRVADLPRALQHVGAAAVAGRLYCIGGFVGSTFAPTADVYVYDPGANEWSATTSLPAARGALAAVALDGRIHAVGGSGPSGSVTTHYVYDPASLEWSERMSFPGNGRNHLAAVALDGALYVAGGRFDGGGQTNSAALDRYDPAANEWTSLAPMPTARSGLGAAVLDGKIIVLGGEVNPAHPNRVFPQVELYDPSTDRWTSLADMPVPRHGIGAVAIGNRIHVPGGAIFAGFGATAHHDVLEVLF